MTARNIEFVGGPRDGESQWIPSDLMTMQVASIPNSTAALYLQAERAAPVKLQRYQLRVLSGIPVRLPSGRYAMDFVGEQ